MELRFEIKQSLYERILLRVIPKVFIRQVATE